MPQGRRNPAARHEEWPPVGVPVASPPRLGHLRLPSNRPDMAAESLVFAAKMIMLRRDPGRPT
jgi:hypothetical protein